jgi:hypothetical protein
MNVKRTTKSLVFCLFTVGYKVGLSVGFRDEGSEDTDGLVDLDLTGLHGG